MPRVKISRIRWPGALGAIIITSTSGGGTIILKWMLNPWANISAFDESRYGAMDSL